jgi:hypothetical protein
MTALTFVAGDISADWNRGSIIEQGFQNGVAVSLGQAVYLDANNVWQLADADVAALNARAVGIVVGVPSGYIYGETSAPINSFPAVCTFGPVYGFQLLSSGQYGWVSKTAGAIDDTAPTGGAYQYILGRSIGASEFFVDPGLTQPASV